MSLISESAQLSWRGKLPGTAAALFICVVGVGGLIMNFSMINWIMRDSTASSGRGRGGNHLP